MLRKDFSIGEKMLVKYETINGIENTDNSSEDTREATIKLRGCGLFASKRIS